MVCKMVKRGLIGAALGTGALGLIFGTAAPSYVKTAFHNARDGVKGAIPDEFEIDRARNEIAALDLDSAKETLGRAIIAVRDQESDISVARKELTRLGHELQAQNDRLERGDLHLTGGSVYSEKALKHDLARGMDRYNILKTTLTEKQETLVILKQNVDTARDGLETLRAAKQDLTARIDNAEARLRQIKAARAARAARLDKFDGTAIGQVTHTVNGVEKRVEQNTVVDQLDEEYSEAGIKVSPMSGPERDVSKEIREEFNSAPKPTEKTGN